MPSIGGCYCSEYWSSALGILLIPMPGPGYLALPLGVGLLLAGFALWIGAKRAQRPSGGVG